MTKNRQTVLNLLLILSLLILPVAAGARSLSESDFSDADTGAAQTSSANLTYQLVVTGVPSQATYGHTIYPKVWAYSQNPDGPVPGARVWITIKHSGSTVYTSGTCTTGAPNGDCAFTVNLNFGAGHFFSILAFGIAPDGSTMFDTTYPNGTSFDILLDPQIYLPYGEGDCGDIGLMDKYFSCRIANSMLYNDEEML